MKVISLFLRAWNYLIAQIQIKMDPVAYARGIGVTVGENVTLIGITGGTFGSEPYLIKLGDHVEVTGRVQFLTHDGGVWVFRERDPSIDVVGPITVGNNVFIGFGSIILPNVMIGNNVIIGAGSVVSKNVPDDVVFAGIPAKKICSMDEYYNKLDDKRLDIRHLEANKKKAFLVDKFNFDCGNEQSEF